MVFNQIQSNRYDVELIKPFKNAQTEIKQRSGSIIKLVLDGELTDSDNTVFRKGDFVTFEPGSVHSSQTNRGCLLLVFQMGINRSI